MSETTKPAASSRIDIKIGETETQTVFMSFARLNELTPLVGGPERIAEFDFNDVIREQTVLICVGKRDERHKLLPDQSMPEELEMEQAEILIDWVKEHVFGFFLRRLQKNIETFDQNAEGLKNMAKLGQLPTGSSPSSSTS